jgi:hypothetical protein
MSEIQLALVNLVGVSKKNCLLDVPTSSHGVLDKGPTTAYGGERAARLVAFYNLGDDSSPDVRKTPSPKRTGEKTSSSSAVTIWLVLAMYFHLVLASSNVSFAVAA